MNNNTLLIILLTVIIICSLFYLININHKENNTLEKFSQRNSLSTYFQQTINSDENTIDKLVAVAGTVALLNNLRLVFSRYNKKPEDPKLGADLPLWLK